VRSELRFVKTVRILQRNGRKRLPSTIKRSHLIPKGIVPTSRPSGRVPKRLPVQFENAADLRGFVPKAPPGVRREHRTQGVFGRQGEEAVLQDVLCFVGAVQHTG